MKKMFSLKKEEKVVILVGLSCILVIVMLGFAKKEFVHKDEYVPVELDKKSDTDVEEEKVVNTDTDKDKLSLKKDKFVYIIGTTLDQRAETYLSNDTKQLTEVELDFSQVNLTLPGTYKVTAKNKTDSVAFDVIVAQSVNPVISAEHESFYFVLEKDSKFQEVIDHAKVSAMDMYGNDITSKITGWKTTLPTTPQTITYNLSVEDKDGNKGIKDISIIYIIK